MLFRISGFPEEGEIVLCNVDRISYNSVFVTLIEYDLTGIIPIFEVSPGRIRNIRDFVKEGRIVVCRVLRTNQHTKNIELSLRRVNEIERKRKLEFMKQEQLSEKIVEIVAKQNKTEYKALYEKITDELFKSYGSLFEAFDAISKKELDISKLKLSKGIMESLEKNINERIKPKIVDITGEIHISCAQSNGIILLKECFSQLIELKKPVGTSFSVSYLGRGSYSFQIKGNDYKTLEEILKSITEHLEEFSKKNKAEFSITRQEKK